MRKPKGLKEFELSSMFKAADSYEFLDKESARGKKFDNIINSADYKILDLLEQLSRDLANEITGYNHASDILDSASEREFQMYARTSNRGSYDDSSDDDDSSDSFDYEFRADHFDTVKENFKEKVSSELGQNSMTRIESFNKLYQLLLNNGFSGSKEDLEKYLKTSNQFKQLCLTTVTRFTG